MSDRKNVANLLPLPGGNFGVSTSDYRADQYNVHKACAALAKRNGGEFFLYLLTNGKPVTVTVGGQSFVIRVTATQVTADDATPAPISVDEFLADDES